MGLASAMASSFDSSWEEGVRGRRLAVMGLPYRGTRTLSKFLNWLFRDGPGTN